jgi:hypothetical protein
MNYNDVKVAISAIVKHGQWMTRFERDACDRLIDSIQWHNVNDKLPETHPVKGTYWHQSKDLAVKVKTFKGWSIGHMKLFDTYHQWYVEGVHGNFEVTEWKEVD